MTFKSEINPIKVLTTNLDHTFFKQEYDMYEYEFWPILHVIGISPT